jgi:hypothetical protein
LGYVCTLFKYLAILFKCVEIFSSHYSSVSTVPFLRIVRLKDFAQETTVLKRYSIDVSIPLYIPYLFMNEYISTGTKSLSTNQPPPSIFRLCLVKFNTQYRGNNLNFENWSRKALYGEVWPRLCK